MPDDHKTKAELIEELNALRSRIAKLQANIGNGQQSKHEESENTFRMVFDNAPEGMLLADAETRKFRTANDALCRELGYTRQEIVELGVEDIHPEEDLPHVVEQFEKLTRGEILVATDIPVKRKDGSVFYADISSAETKVAGRRYLMGIFRDITAHRTAEEELRHSAETFRLAMDATNDAVWDWNIVTNEVYRNPRHATMLGYEPHEFTSSQDEWETRIHPDDKQWVFETLNEHLAGRADYWQGEYRLRAKSGKYVWVLGRGRVVTRSGDGVPMRMIGTNIDITERKQAERALQQSKEKYRKLIDNIPDVVWTSDSEGNSTFISPNVERIYGYTPLEICQQRHDLWLSRVHPDDLQRVEKAYRALLNKNRPFDVEYRIQREDGQWIWLHDRSIATYEKDGVKYADGIFSDITVRKVVEMSLKESRTNLTLAQQIAHVGSWEWNLETGQIAWSDETYRLFGFDPGQIEPTFETFLDIVHPEDREFLKKTFERVTSEGQKYHMEFRVIRPDDVERVLDGRGQVLRDIQGKPLRMFGAIQDITDRRISERQHRLRFQILEALLQQSSLKDMCAGALSLIKANMNCDAAALRIKDGDDYPYFVNDGFSQEFIEAENLLLGHAQEVGGMVNPDGTAVLGCMCGVVLDGKYDQRKPFFTGMGSFWTNNLSWLLASTSTAERCGASCKACNEHGYESVALIPIRSDGQIMGLLQINAERANVFSPNRIQFLEELGLLIRVAFERKKAEQALKQSEEKFRRIAEQGFDVVLTADLDGTLTYASPSAERVFGYSSDEMIGKNAAEFTPESNLPDVIEQFRELAEGNSFSGREVEILRKDGRVALIELNSAPIRDGDKVIGAQASARDITERRRVEKALRQSEAKYRTLVESAGETIASVDGNGVFLFMNTTGAERLGGKPADYIGKYMWDLFPKEIADRQMASVRRVMNTGKGINVIVPTVLQSQMRWYNTTIEPLTHGDSGKVNAAMIIARDIHDRKQAQDELTRYREKMAHADRLASLGTLSATVAHELTQPLTVIRLSLDNLLDELKAASSPETVTRKLEDSLVEISSITSIINRFRTFARKSSTKTVEQVNLKVLAERIVELLGESAKRACVSLQVKDMDQLPLVRLNERDFEQLFFALVQNAIQAADGKRPRSLVISGLVKDQSIELRFADDCGGIAPDDLDAVFEPFFTNKPPGQGTGLGLCIVQDIASRTGGRVDVESEFGKGTTFIITLPHSSEQLP